MSVVFMLTRLVFNNVKRTRFSGNAVNVAIEFLKILLVRKMKR